MAFIQHGAVGGGQGRQRGEGSARGTCAPDATRATREPGPVTKRGVWRVGGLIGAVVYSAVCWTIVYHGARAVIAWNKPAPRIEASAEGLAYGGPVPPR